MAATLRRAIRGTDRSGNGALVHALVRERVDGPVGEATPEGSELQGRGGGAGYAVDRPPASGSDREEHLPTRGSGRAQTAGDAFDGRVEQELLGGEVVVETFADPGEEVQHRERVAPELEEVVVDADGVDAEHLGEHGGETTFALVARRDVLRFQRERVDRRVAEPGAIHLARGGLGDRVHPEERTRHRRGGEPEGELPAEPPHRHGCAGIDDDVRDHLVAECARGDRGDRGVTHDHQAAQFVLDRAQVDKLSVHLHPSVHPAQVLEHAVGPEAPAIAGTHRAGAVAVVDEALPCEQRFVPVAQRHVAAGHPDLAGFPCGHGITVRVDDRHLAPRPRSPDRDGSLRPHDAGVHVVAGDGAGLGLPIRVAERRVRERVAGVLEVLRRPRFAPVADEPQRVERSPRVDGAAGDQPDHRDGEAHDGDGLLVEPLEETGEVPVGEVEAVARGPGEEDRDGGERTCDEPEGCKQREAVVERQVVEDVEHPHHHLVGHHRALRRAGGAGGEEHERRLPGVEGQVGIVVALALELGEREHRGAAGCDPSACLGVGNRQTSLRPARDLAPLFG